MGEKNSVLKVLGGVFAFLTVILIGLLIVNGKYGFLNSFTVGDYTIVKALEIAKDYMVIISLIIVGLAFVPKRGFLGIIVFLIYMAAVVVVIVFTFLPGGFFSY